LFYKFQYSASKKMFTAFTNTFSQILIMPEIDTFSQILTMPEIDDSPNAERSLVSSDLELESCWRRHDLEVEA
jgi:hypothetical protein